MDELIKEVRFQSHALQDTFLKYNSKLRFRKRAYQRFMEDVALLENLFLEIGIGRVFTKINDRISLSFDGKNVKADCSVIIKGELCIGVGKHADRVPPEFQEEVHNNLHLLLIKAIEEHCQG